MRNRTFIIIFTLLSLSTSLKSQSFNDTTVNLEKTIVRLHLLPLGLSVENHLTKHTTLLFDIGAGFSYQSTEINGNRDSDFKLIPYLAIEPRIYTNLQSRKLIGKRIDYHSGAYGAFRLQGGLELESKEWYVQLGPLVGFQRTLGKNGYWNIGIGGGSTIVEEDIGFGLIGDLKLGFIIN